MDSFHVMSNSDLNLMLKLIIDYELMNHDISNVGRTGQFPPRQLPPGELPPRQLLPRQLSPMTIAP